MNKIQQQKVALVAGASGIIGSQLVKTLLRNGWEVIGLSRHALSHPDGIPLVEVDLLDAEDSARALRPLSNITHIFYSARVNAANWTEMVAPNVTMLRNLVSQIEDRAPLQTVSLMQGYKVYGAHLGPFKTPARESDPGVPGAEFNAAQLKWLSHFQRGKTWHWNAIRPGVVGSAVAGNTMNLALSIALYASLCRALNLPLRFPGSPQTGTVSSISRMPDCWQRRPCGRQPRPWRRIRLSMSITVTSGAGANYGRRSHAGLGWRLPRRSGSPFSSYLRTIARNGATLPGSGWWSRNFTAQRRQFCRFRLWLALRHVWRWQQTAAGGLPRMQATDEMFSVCSRS